MPAVTSFLNQTRETLRIYWLLARIMVPLMILAEALARMGVIAAIAPGFGPVMGTLGLPPELGLAWLTGMVVGVWGAVALLFTLVPITSLSTADVTVFSALLLFAHGLPIEQKIIQAAGPSMTLTMLLRVAGGLVYAFVLHRLFVATGWLAGQVQPAWVPSEAALNWGSFLIELAKTMATVLIVLLALSWLLEVLRATGVLELLMRALMPALRLAGIRSKASYLTAVGLFLGISYGAGLLIREARSGSVPAHQIFLSCVFMGFAHAVIEDTVVVVAIGADIWPILVGRLVFAIIATATIAALIRRLPERQFRRWIFRYPAG